MKLNKWISMKATIVYLIVLSAIAALGTFISQGQSAAFYLENYGPLMGKFLIVTGLADLYHSPWFIALGVALCLVILSCTLRRLRGRKSVTKIGSVLLHLSFVVIVSGALVSAATHAAQDIELVQGQKATLKAGALAGAQVDLKDFTVEWYDNGSAAQYTSDLTFRRDGRSTQKALSVNHPLRQGFVTIYQERYGWELRGTVTSDGKTRPFRLREGDDFEIAPGLALATIFVPNFDMTDPELHTLTAEPRNPRLVCAIEQDGQIASDLAYLEPGETDRIGEVEIHFERFLPYTGLRVKYDPGIPVVFVGFLLSILGLALRFLPRKERTPHASHR